MRTLRISVATLLLASSASAQRATRPASTDPWEVTELTNRPSLTLELPALNTVRAAGAGRAAAFEVRPVLLVRCQDRQLDVFISTGSVLDSDDNVLTPVRIQWGSEPPTDSRWSRSTDSMSAFAPDPRALLRQLVTHQDLQLEIH